MFTDVIEEGALFVHDDREKFKEDFVGKAYEKKSNVSTFALHYIDSGVSS